MADHPLDRSAAWPDAAGSRTGSRDRARWALWLACALLALLALRVAALAFNATDLFFDEAQYWAWSEEPAFGYYSKPPLIAWVIALATGACGSGEFCVRLPSPLLHTLTAIAIFALATRLYDVRTGFWSAIVYATLPAVSLSSGIISTDVPLLLFWAIALYGLVALLDTRAVWPALLLGVALGLGLNAKYAMVYFVLCLGVFLVATPARRTLLADWRLWFALAIAVAMIAPNLAWNASHSFATFAHTADNANLGARLGRPDKALEFIGAQFGVFGPILFAALIVIAVRAYRQGLPAPDRLLLAFALPVLVVVVGLALVSRAHANWAAVSYVAATVLVTATMLRDASRRWFVGSLALHGALALLIAVALTQAGRAKLPFGGPDPFARTLGWPAIAREVKSRLDAARAAGTPFAAVLAEDRALIAELLYYMREDETPLYTWRGPGRPRDHFELTRAYHAGAPAPVLFVSLHAPAQTVLGAFDEVAPLATVDVPAGLGRPRTLHMLRMSGFRSEAAPATPPPTSSQPQR